MSLCNYFKFEVLVIDDINIDIASIVLNVKEKF